MLVKSIVSLLPFLVWTSNAKFGPPYPITASWFADRFTKVEWDNALDEFKSIGGDTVLLRAPKLVVRSKEDIMADPHFADCKVNSTKPGLPPVHCIQDAEDEIKAAGLLLTGFATYEYEENFSDRIMHCPHKYDRKIVSSRTYYRLVIADMGFDCAYSPANETFVTVVLTSFAGIDPHELVLQSAAERNMKVYLGMPDSIDISTLDIDHDRKVWLYEGFFYFLFYVLDEHNIRFGMNGSDVIEYSSSTVETLSMNHKISRNRVQSYCAGLMSKQFRKAMRELKQFNRINNRKEPHNYQLQKAATKSFAGYYIHKDVYLTKFVISDSSKDVLGLPEVCYFFQIDETILYVNENRTYAVSAQINMHKQFENSTINQHVEGLKSFFTNAGSVYQGRSVLILHEGRGMGLAAHYWPSEENLAIAKNDAVLFSILNNTVPGMTANTTYSQVYTASTLQLFPELMKAFKNVTAGNPGFPNSTAMLWLMIESYENLSDNPCLPIDARGSGMDMRIQRTSKARIDSSISALGYFPQKISAFAWDNDFLCTDKQHSKRLLSEINEDAARPIVTSCGFHSPTNLSIVVTGFNIDGPESFTVTYTDKSGKLCTELIDGYYYELDYGLRHHKVPSMSYIMLWDMQGLSKLKQSGYISVTKAVSNQACTFAYLFSGPRSANLH